MILVSLLPLADQAAIRDLVELAVRHGRLFGFDAVPQHLVQAVEARLFFHGYATTWDGPHLVVGRLV